MKINKTLQLFTIVIFSYFSNAQENPSISSLMQYESHPVELSTGIPNIAIPLFKVPTYSNDMTVNLSLQYSPSSAAAYETLSGNCGRGWTLLYGGAISKEFNGDLEFNAPNNQFGMYQFNFMGMNGKFNLTKNGSQVSVIMSENKGNILEVNVDYSSNSNTVNSFTIFDDKGYRYEFAAIEQFIYVKSIYHTTPVDQDYRIPFKSAYRITKVLDANGIELVNFIYDTYNPVESYYVFGETNIKKEIKDIIVKGSGKVSFEKVYNYTDGSVKINKMIVHDFKDNAVKRFDFLFEGYNLSQVDESDFTKTNTLSYRLYYKNPVLITDSDKVGVDVWGYKNTYYKWCEWIQQPIVGQWIPSDIPTSTSPEACLNTVLQKMVLPTGGCIIYEFESNSYSYRAGGAMGGNDPDYFFRLNTKK